MGRVPPLPSQAPCSRSHLALDEEDQKQLEEGLVVPIARRLPASLSLGVQQPGDVHAGSHRGPVCPRWVWGEGQSPSGGHRHRDAKYLSRTYRGECPKGQSHGGPTYPLLWGQSQGTCRDQKPEGQRWGTHVPPLLWGQSPRGHRHGGPPWPPPWGGTRTLSPQGQGGPGLPPRAAAASPDVRGNGAMTSPDTATAKSRQGLRRDKHGAAGLLSAERAKAGARA